jgi:two-component system chemotaxis sensor kinase CheA
VSDLRHPGQLRSAWDHVVLPPEVSAFEAGYLRRMNRVGLAFFLLHIPAMVLVAWGNSTGPWFALALTTAIVAGPAAAYATLKNPRSVSVVYGVAAMFMGGALVHFGQGPVQIEMHFYFFALIAMLAVFGNPMVIVAAAVTVTLHHLVLWWLLPRSIFNYDAPYWVVGVHAAFVVLVSAAGCFIARSFFDNVIGLERIVGVRTAELDRRNRDMRLVLDHVSQGFFTIDRRGRPSAERSRAVDQWLGPCGADETFFDWIERKSPEFAAQSRVAFDEVIAAVMPLALTLDQMPRELPLTAAQYRVAYLPIGEDETPERFLVVMTDVTADVERERAERDRREAMQVFEQLLHDRTAVNDFFDEGSALVDALTTRAVDELQAVKRMLHTLKGNSAIFGLGSLSSLCHELEEIVAEEGALRPPDRARLRAHWDAVVANVERMVGARRRVIEIEEAQYVALERSIRLGAPRAAQLEAVRALKREPTERRLEHFAEQARRIATRLGKSMDVRVEGNDLRMDPTQWAGFWSAFIHAVRNATDHGLEGQEERASAGKAERGTVRLGTYERGDRFVVEIADDGRGIDWPLVAVKAAQLGLPGGTEQELHAALFLDGVSTASHVTDISGRGIGMGALRAATLALRGTIEIETELGLGTTLRMVFPPTALAADAGPSADAHAAPS